MFFWPSCRKTLFALRLLMRLALTVLLMWVSGCLPLFARGASIPSTVAGCTLYVFGAETGICDQGTFG